MSKFGIECGEVKVSNEILLLIQDQVESLIRGFMENLVKDNKGRQVGYRLFDEYLSKLMGEPAFETNYINMSE
jgi:hypothetical protein